MYRESLASTILAFFPCFVLILIFTDVADGGTWCYSYYKYPYRQYCEMGCCGNKMDEYCCVSVGLVVGVVIGIGIMIGVVAAVVCCCVKKKGRVGTVFSAPPRNNLTVISTGGMVAPPGPGYANYPPAGQVTGYYPPPTYTAPPPGYPVPGPSGMPQPGYTYTQPPPSYGEVTKRGVFNETGYGQPQLINNSNG